MAVQQDEYESVTSPSVISSLLNTMIESGGVTLCLATPDARPEPVVLMEQHAGETLVMDLSSVDYLLSRLQQGEQFFFAGSVTGKSGADTAVIFDGDPSFWWSFSLL
ncbi:hypothetical protein [Halomonas sp. 15WGF]|uniref:hypothetical protein n=1 Tax=Halomonas sp. 15WGF TaxID=2570357 RepID=UPI00201E707D|nr:hypothetical protein [Halomonas sp. 15WGF]